MTQPGRATNLLDVRGLDVHYGQAQALFGLDLYVGPGEIVCLLGGNASGKSTTMKAILGMVRPTAGTLRFDGADITGLPTATRIVRGIASVPEARRVFGAMTVQENLVVGAFTRTGSARRQIAADIAEMFDRFPRLALRRHQQAGVLSGGEQQMLAFARALMSHPKLICMDEPTMGLAPKLVDEVLGQIAQLNADTSVAVLIVEQQAELALSIAHRGYVLATGHLVMHGAADELRGDPAVQAAYLGRTPDPAANTKDT